MPTLIAAPPLFCGAALSSWRMLLWPIGGVLVLGALLVIGNWWWRHRVDQQQPILFLLEQLLWHFRMPLLLVGSGSLALIGMGFAAGSQFSIVLFVLLSALTVVGLGAIAWWLWPKDAAEGNLFDLVPLPDLEWPAFENAQDRMMRGWVEHRTHQMKTNPPAFSGATFGAIALEVSKEASEIYEKQTPLSVSLDDLLKGVERTAADLKILCNHLPLAGHFTLAAIERQIEFAVKRGRLLYASLFLVLSFFNPGNLVRVLLAFVQQKSPWEHLLRELQGWIYGHYTERLGYHMALIHSRRSPPPPDALHKAFAEQERKRGESVRLQKLGWLTAMGLFGFVFYLLLQLTNITLVYGVPGFGLGIVCLGVAGWGIWQLRAPKHWEPLWKSILPEWPETPPPEGERELIARRQMAAVLREHKQAPNSRNAQDVKELPKFYGDLMLDLWEACYSAYRPPDESDPDRTSREFTLPQGFAGVEDLCRALHVWFNSTATLPSTLRQLERFGLNLESIYLYTKRQSDEAQAEHSEPPIPPVPTSPAGDGGADALPQPDQVDPPVPETNVQLPALQADLLPAESPDDKEDEDEEGEAKTGRGKKVLGWFGKVGKSLGNIVKDFALGQIHQHLLKLLTDGIGERLINIYGSRHPKATFSPREPEAELRLVLLLGRDLSACEVLLNALIDTPAPPLPTPDGEPLTPTRQSIDADGIPIQFEIEKMPSSVEETETLQALADVLQHRRYQRIILVDEIDYGARERIARLLQYLADEALRTSEVGSMALALLGVEKLKPLSWEPPYDDFLEDAPTRRKSQRIRNAVLAWSEAITQIHTMKTIYPIGLPADKAPWGLPSLRRFLGLPAIDKDESEEPPDVDSAKASAPTKVSETKKNHHSVDEVSPQTHIEQPPKETQ